MAFPTPEEAIANFIAGQVKNTWLDFSYKNVHCQLYIRKSQRLISGTIVSALDMATITKKTMPLVPNGTLKKVLNVMENQAREHGFAIVFVECVLAKWMQNYMLRLGYTLTDDGESHNFYKKL